MDIRYNNGLIELRAKGTEYPVCCVPITNIKYFVMADVEEEIQKPKPALQQPIPRVEVVSDLPPAPDRVVASDVMADFVPEAAFSRYTRGVGGKKHTVTAVKPGPEDPEAA
jgi:hypothetical protein